MNWLCKIGLHKWYDIDGRFERICRRCGRDELRLSSLDKYLVYNDKIGE
jgi:hypothetical protein